MNAKINFQNLIRQLLPSHKRQPIRLRLLAALTSPLATLFADFDKWRKDTRMLVNVTSQVGVLEGFLREKYGDASITIETFHEQGFAVGLAPEGEAYAQEIGMTTDPGEVPLRGESHEQFGDVDFVLHVPDGVDMEQIKADAERYKLATITFKIKTI